MRKSLISLFVVGAMALLPSIASAQWHGGGGHGGGGWHGGHGGGHDHSSFSLFLGFGGYSGVGFGGTYHDGSGYHFKGGFSISRKEFEVGGTSPISDNLDVELDVIAK